MARKRKRRTGGARNHYIPAYDNRKQKERERKLDAERDKLRAQEINKYWVHVFRGGAPQ